MLNKNIRLYFLFSLGLTWLLVLPQIFSHYGIAKFGLSDNWHFLGALGPIVAAFYVAKKTGFLSNWCTGLINFRVGAGWLSIAILSPIVLFFIGYLVAFLIASPIANIDSLIRDGTINPGWVYISLVSAIVYGVGEEAGWRGFALPVLQNKMNALKATLLLATLHAIWHIPMFFYRFEFSVIMIIGFFSGLVAGAIWFTFIYNSTNGSTLMVIIWHSVWNIVNQFAMLLSDVILATMSTCVMLLAIYVIIKWGPESLSSKPRYKFS